MAMTPERERDLGAAQLLVASPPTLSFGLVACVGIMWHGNGGREMSVSEGRKGFRKSHRGQGREG